MRSEPSFVRSNDNYYYFSPIFSGVRMRYVRLWTRSVTSDNAFGCRSLPRKHAFLSRVIFSYDREHRWSEDRRLPSAPCRIRTRLLCNRFLIKINWIFRWIYVLLAPDTCARAMGDCFDGLSEKVGEGIKKKGRIKKQKKTSCRVTGIVPTFLLY